MSREQDSVAVIAAEMRERGRSCGYELIRAWADRLAALPREAAPQASGGDDDLDSSDELIDELTYLAEVDFNAECCNSQFPISMLRRVLKETIRRLATTDSARQSQPGATGGAVDVETLAEVIDLSDRAEELAERLVAAGPKAAQVSASETHEISEWIGAAAPLLRALAHPQAAGSAPGEARNSEHDRMAEGTP